MSMIADLPLTYLTNWEQLIGKLLQHKKEIEMFSLITTKCSTARKGGWKKLIADKILR